MFLSKQALLNTALDQFSIPGDPAFPLNQAFEAPRDRQDAETLRQYVCESGSESGCAWRWLIKAFRYLSQVRQELAIRLIARLYAGNSNAPSKVSAGLHMDGGEVMS